MTCMPRTSSSQANPLLRQDELELKSRFGLAFVPGDGAAQGTVFKDGSSVHLYHDITRSAASIA